MAGTQLKIQEPACRDDNIVVAAFMHGLGRKI
jgi:hypothetical protein